MKRHALSDEQWESIEESMPQNDGPGRPWSDHRLIIDAILWIHATGAALARFAGTLRDRGRPCMNAFGVGRRREFGTKSWTVSQARRHADGQLDWELFCVDGSVARSHKAAAGAPLRS